MSTDEPVPLEGQGLAEVPTLSHNSQPKSRFEKKFNEFNTNY